MIRGQGSQFGRPTDQKNSKNTSQEKKQPLVSEEDDRDALVKQKKPAPQKTEEAVEPVKAAEPQPEEDNSQTPAPQTEEIPDFSGLQGLPLQFAVLDYNIGKVRMLMAQGKHNIIIADSFNAFYDEGVEVIDAFDMSRDAAEALEATRLALNTQKDQTITHNSVLLKFEEAKTCFTEKKDQQTSMYLLAEALVLCEKNFLNYKDHMAFTPYTGDNNKPKA